MSNKKVHFTNHSIERFKERFYNECKGKSDSEVRRHMYDMIQKSSVDRSFLNNTRYMMVLHDKYGYDLNFEFLRHSNVIFVARKDRDRRVILTCYAPDNRVFGKKVKFKKKKEVPPEIMEYELTYR